MFANNMQITCKSCHTYSASKTLGQKRSSMSAVTPLFGNLTSRCQNHMMRSSMISLRSLSVLMDRSSNSVQHTAIQLVQQNSPLRRFQDDALDGAAIVQHALRKGLQRDERGFLDIVILLTSRHGIDAAVFKEALDMFRHLSCLHSPYQIHMVHTVGSHQRTSGSFAQS